MTGDRVPGGCLCTLSTEAGGDGKGGFSLRDARDEVRWPQVPQVPPGGWFRCGGG